MIQGFINKFSNSIGVDLGTANTLVTVLGHGIVIDEPSIVALNTKTGRVVAVGNDAKIMLGKNPHHIRVVRPLVDGVISDYEVTEEMLSYFIKKAEEISPKMFRPRVVVGIPSNITNVEHRAAYDASISAGARQVFIVEEPMAAAIGARLPIFEATGSMVIDIGGGTTDIAVVSLGGMLRSKKITIAGDQFNSDIIDYVRDTYKLLIGEKTAEDIKIALASALPLETPITKVVRGRDVITGLPREIILRDADIRLALAASVAVLVEGTKEVLEHTPPEVVSDIMNRGIVMTGGGALIRGLPELIGEQTGILVSVPEDPLTAVVRGTGMILQDMDRYQDVFVKDEYEVKSNFS